VSHGVGLRDRAVIAVLVYTAARIGAVASLKRGSLTHDGSQWTLRFAKKAGKSREIPSAMICKGWHWLTWQPPS
jgi:integrase/recombinase XerD